MLPIVGIGASAGGLRALENLFSHVPVDSGFAFVVIQHLDPRHTSILRDLIARSTQMPVLTAQEGTRAEADHVYVIPPGNDIRIAGGVFMVSAQTASGNAVNTFFGSLAEDRGASAIGIVLSGSGSDGTQGLLAIKERGGLTIAQRPDTAEHQGMPRSAIDAGVIDYVLMVEEMPAMLRGRGGRGLTDARERIAAVSVEQVAAGLPRILEILQQATGHDFSRYKKGTVSRRTLRRILQLRISSVDAYLERLAKDPPEAGALLNEIRIGVTQFFRDPQVFDYLAKHVAPRIVAGKKEGQAVRIWVPGCASGEEAYSIAIVLLEVLTTMGQAPFVQIFGTDIDEAAVAEARHGRFPFDIKKDVSPERLSRFFLRDENSYQVLPQVREMCVFSIHNLIHDPPFSALDLISCRNVLIYMEADLQKKLFPIFHYALNPGGHLLLGVAEGPTGRSDLFETVDKQSHLFRRVEVTKRVEVEFPHPRGVVARPTLPREIRPRLTTDQMMCAGFERLMLQEYTSPGALVNASGEVLCFAGPTARYLQPPVGPPSGNILDTAPAGLRIELRAALQEAVTTGKRVVRDNVLVNLEDDTHRLRLIVRPQPSLGQPATLYLIVLEERPAATGDVIHASQPLIVESLETELRLTRADLSHAVQQLESANQELTSSNEELQSANEELQSSNEELQTSQEELKSVNEELETVNAELQRKVEELAHAHDDLQNFFSGSQVATLFVDRGLRVGRFTPAAARIFHLIDNDIGRPLSDLSPRLAGVNLAADLSDVMRSQTPIDREVEALDKSGWFLLRVLPYHTDENTIAGAILTLTDITRLKATEADLRRLATVVTDSNDAITVQDLEGHIRAWNRGAAELYGYSEQEALRMKSEALVPEEGRLEARHLIDAIKRGEHLVSLEVKRRTKSGRVLDVWLTITKLVDSEGRPVAVATTERDMTERKRAEQAALLLSFDAIFVWRLGGVIESWNRGAEALYGFTESEATGRNPHELLETVFPVSAGETERVLKDLGTWEGELSQRTKDGREIVVASRFQLIPSEHGIGRVLEVNRDITQRKWLEQQRVEEAQRKDEFLATLGHELRNPLATLSVGLQLARRSSELEPTLKERLDMMDRQLTHVMRLVDDLLDIGRINAGKIELQLAPVELPEILANSLEEVRTEIESRRHEVVLQIQPGRHRVRGDAARLIQVLANLIDNAAKYTEPGGRISVSLSREDGSEVVRVEDTGIGISPEDLSRVFDLFAQVRAHQQTKTGGLGIGLAIVRKLLQLHGGAIEATSAGVGRGSTFTMRVPALEHEVPSTPAPDQSRDESHGSKPIRRVLIVDDNEEFATSLAELLRLDGHQVWVANDGLKAIEIAKSTELDVVLMDLAMPGLDGFETATRIRALPGCERLRMVALTGKGRESDRARTREAGFEWHLLKPPNHAFLSEFVAKLNHQR